MVTGGVHQIQTFVLRLIHLHRSMWTCALLSQVQVDLLQLQGLIPQGDLQRPKSPGMQHSLYHTVALRHGDLHWIGL